MTINLENKVALVTGSSTGLGLEIALELGRCGAYVALNYSGNEARGKKALSKLKAEGLKGGLYRADVTNAESINRMVKNIEHDAGAPIQILVPCATGPQPPLPIEEYSWEIYQEMVDFFIKSPFLLTQATIKGMKKEKWGRIINLGSEVFEAAVGNFSAYVAGKGGQKGWTYSMATELAPFGVTVNIISPGWIPTERHAGTPKKELDEYEKTIPIGRWGKPKDITSTVAWLASEQASFITGQTVCVNGGRTVS